jgi:cell wall-active antibiotic response 4TMS protein YvqF
LIAPIQPDSDALTIKGRAIGPFILIGIGVIFLLQNFHAFELDALIDRFWPLLLIAVGGFLVWRRSERQS